MIVGLRRPLRGAASHVAVALLGVAAGAGLAWTAGHRTALAAVTTHGEWVYFKAPGTADSVRAYVAYPERKDKAPAVIVIHEIFGLTDWEPTVVDRLAKSGYVAIVPDLLSSKFGRSPADPDSGRKLVAELEPARITRDLDAAYAYLNGLPAVRGGDIGVMGFCWGGGQSFRYATDNPQLQRGRGLLRASARQRGSGPDPGAAAWRLRRERRADRRVAAGSRGAAQGPEQALHVRDLLRHRPRLPQAGAPGIRRPRGRAGLGEYSGILQTDLGRVRRF